MKSWLRAWFWPVLYFTLMSVLITWPLAAHMTDSVVGQLGDNVYFVWLIGWVEKAVFQLHRSPLFVPTLNYPEGWYLASTEITPSMILTALPVSLPFGPVAGYNFSILVSFVLSGLAVYLWVVRLSGNRLAGFIGGTIFAFSPYRFAHYLIGHLNLLGTHWIAFYFMALHDILRRTQPSRRSWPVVWAALFLGLIGLTSLYYLYMTLLVTLVFVCGYLLLERRQAAPHPGLWKRLGTTGLLALPLVLIAVLPYLQLARSGSLAPRPLEYVRQYSASPTDFALPSTVSVVWGRWVWEHFDRSLWPEATLYLGMAACALAAIAFFKRKELPVGKGFVYLLALTGGAAFVLALGTDLHWLSRPVMVDVPRFLLRWHPNPQAFIPLPGRFLFEWLPFYSSMRVWMRYGIFVLLVVAVLAGLGAGWLMGKVRGKGSYALGAGLLLLVLLDFYPRQQPLARIEARPVDYWLASQPGDGAVVQFPFSQVENQEQIYYTLIHGKPFLGGFFNAFPPPQYERIRPAMETFPSPESVSLLRQLGVQYVLVDALSYPDFTSVNASALSNGLTFVGEVDGQYVYVLASP
jgi:hypothetical protein